MFLPFLPYILAIVGAGLLLGQPLPSAPTAPLLHTVLALLLPLLLGWLVGLLPEAWAGSRAPLRLSRRRWLNLLLWLGVLGVTPMLGNLGAALAGLPAAEELLLALLLVNFWLADTLCLRPPHFHDGAARSAHPLARPPGFFRVLALPLPFLVLAWLGIALLTLLENLPDGIVGGLNRLAQLLPVAGLVGMLPILQLLASAVFYLFCMAVLMPPLVRLCWGLRPLATPAAQQAVQEELKENGVSVRQVLAWPEEMTEFATAGVIGVLPRFRYLLFSNSLAHALTEEEIRSVTAHEAAHLKFRHPWYFLCAVLAAILLVEIASQAVQLGGLLLGIPLPAWVAALVELVGLLLFLRLGFGALSRSFERQADGHALRRVGLAAFQSAMAKVSRLNGIAPELDNWHHHGIAQRIAFLVAALDQPERLRRHDQLVARAKTVCLALLALGLMGQGLLAATPWATGAMESYWQQRVQARLESHQPLGPGDLPGLQGLAMLAFQRHDMARAERYFRLILSVAPNDAQAQNNLAWVLVTRPQAEEDALREGLALAQSASRGDPSAYVWDTLAEAYARLRLPKQALQAALEALRLAQAGQGRGGEGLDYYHQRVKLFSGQAAELPAPSPRPEQAPSAGGRPIAQPLKRGVTA